MRRRRQRVRDLTPLDVARVKRAVHKGDLAALTALASALSFADARALVEAAMADVRAADGVPGGRP